MNLRLFKFLLVAAISVATNLFYSSCESISKEKGRVFYTMTLEDSVVLDLPLLRFQEFNDTMYAYDYYEKSIVLLDSGFKVQDRLGSFGDGPKENLLVRNYKILPNGLAAIFDVEKNTFKIQDFNDSVYVYQKFDFDIEGGLYWDRETLFTMSLRDKLKFDFAMFSTNSGINQPIEAINNLFGEDYSGLIYQGKLLSNEKKIVFTSYFSSFWFVMDQKTGEVQSGSYLHDYEQPKVLDNGSMVMLEDAPELVYDSFMNENEVFIISNVGHKDFPDQRIMDIYDLDFNYLRSYPLPNLNFTTPDEGFYLGTGSIAVLYEDILYFFKMNEVD